MKKKKILFCHTSLSTFVKNDLDFLSTKYEVIPFYYASGKTKLLKIRNIFSSFIFTLTWIWGVDAVYCWFGGYHCFWPVFIAKLLRKKSIIIVGGYDAGNIPSLNYGVFHKPSALQSCIRRTYKAATYLCPVSQALVASINKYSDPSGVGFKIGLLHHIPEIKNKIKIIPTDYDESYWTFDTNKKREGILALAYVSNPETYKLKGFDLLTECARILPEYKFTFAGFSPSMTVKYKKDLPANITLMSFQSKEQARELYQQHKIFVIPSMTEGLPNTLCEAMLCGCLPIGSNVSVISEIIGQNGFILENKNATKLAQLIFNASNIEKYSHENIRQRIIHLFPFGSRIKVILDLISEP